MSSPDRVSRFDRSRRGDHLRSQSHSPPIPSRFRARPDEDDSADVATAGGQQAYNLNQSVFQIITAAGSRVDNNSRAESDSDNGVSEDEETNEIVKEGMKRTAKDLSKSAMPLNQRDAKDGEGRLSKSFSKLRLKNLRESTSRKSRDFDKETSAHSVSDTISEEPETKTVSLGNDDTTPKVQVTDEAVGTIVTQSNAGASMLGELVYTHENEDSNPYEDQNSESLVQLSKRLQDIFELESEEEVHAEYPCWLLDSVLLEGHLYITSKHICFYAYMPKRQNATLKSGHLYKRGKKSPRFTRYWFILKGDVVSYYLDAAELYFPSGNIDLHYAIEARLGEVKDKTPSTTFEISTADRVYHFRADSPSSAAEWVKALQKVIFRSHNDGDSKKTAIPLENIIDVEESPVLDFADTFKLRAYHDDAFTIDEYFFSFFSFGKDAYEIIRLLVRDTPAQKAADAIKEEKEQNALKPEESKTASRLSIVDNEGRLTPVLPLTVKDTNQGAASPTAHNPMSPHRVRRSGDFSRSNLDVGRGVSPASSTRSASKRSSFGGSTRDHSYRSRTVSPNQDRSELSGDSWAQSMDREQSVASSDAFKMSDDDETSASKMLSGSELFPPTITGMHKPHSISIGPLDREGPRSDGLRIKTESGDERKHRAHSFADNNYKHTSDQDKSSYNWTSWLKKHSKRATEVITSATAAPSSYIEKVSDMWSGGKRHYNEQGEEITNSDDEDADNEDDEGGTSLTAADRFRQRFALPATERLVATYHGSLYKNIPIYGKIYIGNRHICFRPIIGTRVRMMILPMKDVENVDKERGFRFGMSGLVITIRGHQEEFLEFTTQTARDDCGSTIAKTMENIHLHQDDQAWLDGEKEDADVAKKEHEALQEARPGQETDLQMPRGAKVLEGPENATDMPPIIFDDPHTSIVNFKPQESLRITCLTIGSRGDVQPYIALAKGLLKDGHRVKIATHHEFGDWVISHGIEFAPVEGDPAELMRICVENGMFTYSFLKEATSKFRGWIDSLLSSAWTACQDTDLLIESPSAMAGIHIAEALGIPYFRAFTMPWTRTRAYPHAFAVPEHKMGGAYNYFSYVMFDNLFWKGISGQVNRWRKESLGLRGTNLSKMGSNKVPFLYNFSPAVVVPPLDFNDWVRVTGYWFLDETSTFTPPQELVDFIAKARADGKPIVYVGFGSIVVSDPQALTQTVVDSVLKADVRCILAKGWSDRLGNRDASLPEVTLPEEIISIKATPHDWLFGQCDAAVHHGGAGTTGASLRAGIPTIIKPFFGDQFFFGGRVEDLGVGICMRKLNVVVFSRALWEATRSGRMKSKAQLLGEQIRSEDGVSTAIESIYRDMDYARSLIKPPTSDQPLDESEESWTLVSGGDDGDESEDYVPHHSNTEPITKEEKHKAEGSEEEREAGNLEMMKNLRDALSISKTLKGNPTKSLGG